MKPRAGVNASTSRYLLFFHFPFAIPAKISLHWAVAAGQKVAVESLVDLGAYPYTRDGTDPYVYDERFW